LSSSVDSFQSEIGKFHEGLADTINQIQKDFLKIKFQFEEIKNKVNQNVSNILDSTADKTRSVIHDEIKRKENNAAEFK
jgi:hypothetical protein